MTEVHTEEDGVLGENIFDYPGGIDAIRRPDRFSAGDGADELLFDQTGNDNYLRGVLYYGDYRTYAQGVCFLNFDEDGFDRAEFLEDIILDQLTGYGGIFIGSVVNNMTDEGIEGATVTINETKRTVITDEDGFFIFERVPVETFTVNVEKWGFTTVESAEFTFDGQMQLNSEIRMLHPEISLASDDISVQVANNEEFTYDLTLTNVGDGPLVFDNTVRGTPVEGEFWDQIEAVNTGDITEDARLQATLFFQDHFWVAGGMQSDMPNHLYKITRDGELVDSYEQAAYSNYGWRSLTTDGEYIYGTDSDYISQIDPESGQVTDFQIPAPLNPTYTITYDNENELFWVSSVTTDIFGIDRDGNEIGFIRNSGRFRISGLAYFPDDVDGYKLYLLENSREDGAVRVWKLDTETGDAIEIDVLNVAEGERSGACTLTNELYPFTWAFLVQMQADDDYLRIFEASSDFYWLDIHPRSAFLDPNEEMELHFDFAAGNLPYDETYEAYMQLTHNTPVEGSIWIHIAMTVLENSAPGVTEIPLDYGLSSVYPNPFNAVSNINFSLDRAADVKLTVHDLTGRQVTELVNEHRGSGKYTVQLNSEGWASGMYMIRLTDGSRVSMKKVALLK
ncbi:T9SS type A sorting domain-containing protein [bacterium]|nr:T9SS type A sorting domain-containing protein [bacterium]